MCFLKKFGIKKVDEKSNSVQVYAVCSSMKAQNDKGNGKVRMNSFSVDGFSTMKGGRTCLEYAPLYFLYF